MILKSFVEIMAQNDSRKTLRTLFEEEKYDYIYIPRIQRDYAQGRTDNEATVIRDNILDDVASCEPLSWGIIFGVSEKDREMEDGSHKKCFIPIDGQQRLTTLYLLALYGEKKHNVPFGYLMGFNYETRSASRDFLSALVENWHGEKEEGEDLKEHILNQGWFLNYWSLDPTVDAVLNMLNVIDSRFKEAPEAFENLERISFEFLDLDYLNLNETLYLKMNSRGKKLSQFDRIKSEIDKILPDDMLKDTDCKFSLYEEEDSHLESLHAFAEKWRYCIDREWSNLFWNRETHNFDIPLLAFLSNWLIVFAGEKYQHTDNLIALNYNDKDFFLPWKYFGDFLNEANVKQYLEEIAILLNKLYHNRNKEIVKDLISIPKSYPERAFRFGLLTYKDDDYSSQEFAEWKRFIRNYSVNAVNDKRSFFDFINRIRKDFACHSTNILPHLASLHEQKANEPNMQLREEYFKAKILDCNTELSPMIRKAEEHPMLNGRLRPLLIDGDKFDETTFAKIWSNFLKWFGEDGNALVFKEGDAESLRRRRSEFARAFTKCIVRQEQLFNDWRVLDFAAGTLKDRLQRERFNKIFRTCLLSDDLDDIEELQCENANEIEFIQAKETLLQPGVIEGILERDIGSRLRFRWYYNSLCFYPENGRKTDERIGIDRLNDCSGWDRNRNHTLAYLQSKSYVIDAKSVSDDKSVALWWGSDIYFKHHDHSEIMFCWTSDYNLGIINKEYQWIKRRVPVEGENPNFMFCTVGMDEYQIEQEIGTLINDYLEEQKELLIERE